VLCAFGWALDFCGPSAWWFSLGFAASGSAGGGAFGVLLLWMFLGVPF